MSGYAPAVTEHSRWIIFALLGAFFAAASNVLSKPALDRMDVSVANAIRAGVLLAVLVGVTTAAGNWGTLRHTPRMSLVLISLAGVAAALSWLFGYRALQLTTVNNSYPIDKLSVVFAVLLAVVFLRRAAEPGQLDRGGDDAGRRVPRDAAVRLPDGRSVAGVRVPPEESGGSDASRSTDTGYHAGMWYRTRSRGMGAVLGLTIAWWGGPAGAEVRVVMEEVVVDGRLPGAGAEAVGVGEVADFGGFRLSKVDQDTADAMADLARYREKGLWERVFRETEALREREASGLVAVTSGAQGAAAGGALPDAVLYAPLDGRLWREVAELPAAGREAFRLFYDAAADELMQTMRRPGQIGTAAELEAGERLVERYFMASAGPVGTDRLGDLAFERGDFARAAALWDAVLTYHTGQAVDPLRLRVKHTVALHRAGDASGFAAAREGLLARDAGATVMVGGREVTVAELLDGLGAAAGGQKQSDPAAAPVAEARPWASAVEDGAAEQEPRWRCTFLTDRGQVKLMEAVQSSWSVQGSGVHRAIPAVAADGRRVYANWLGAVFALDRETGKLLWTSRGFDEMVTGFAEMFERGSVMSPGRFTLAVSGSGSGGGGGGVVLATALPTERNRWNEPYRMQAYDAATGRVKWSSQGVGALEDAGFCGGPVAVGADVLVVTYPQEGRTLTLRRLAASDGSERWSLPLGEFEPMNSRHGYEIAPMATVELAGDRVYVLTNGGALVAVDAGGAGGGSGGGPSIAWALKFAPPVHLGEQNYNRQGAGPYTDRPGSVRVDGGVIYIKEAGGNRLLAVDAESGRLLWSHLADRDTVIADHDEKRLYLLGADLMAREIGSGGAAWSRRLRSSAVPGSLAVAGGKVVVSSERGLLVLDPATGDIVRTFDPEALGSQGTTFTLLDGLTLIATPTGIAAYGPPDTEAASGSPPPQPATRPTDPASPPE